MNKNSIGLRRPWSRALLAALLAGSLAFSPLAAFAIDEASDSAEPTVEAFTEPADDVSAAEVVEDADSSSPAEELPVPSEEELAAQEPSAPTDDGADEASPTNEAVPVEDPSPSPAPSMEPSASGLSVDRPSAAPAAETTVTVYYCEMVYYDDPSFNDPTGFRLLGSHTYDGVTVGEEIDPWDYVRDIPDYVFFDGWATDPIASADPEQNTVQLNYFRAKSPCTVNYYSISDGDAFADDPGIDTVISEVNGQTVRFDRMGTYEIESQPLGTEIDSALLAVPVDNMAYVDADKESVIVAGAVASNELNLFYTPVPAAAPDDAPEAGAPEPTPPAPPAPSEPEGDNVEGGNGNGGSDLPEVDGNLGNVGVSGATGNEESDDSAVQESGIAARPGSSGQGADGKPASKSTGATVVEDGDSSRDASGSADRLPQTGDSLVLAVGILSVAAAAAGVAFIARRRCQH